MKAIKKAQNGATTNPKETLSQKNARIRKEIEDREKRIETSQKEKEKNSYSNARANKVVGRKMKNGGSVAKDGKWIQKATASIKRRGTEGKCTPITKPGCTGKARTLAKTFKKIAKSNKKK